MTVLGVDGDIGQLAVDPHAQLDALPVALVRAEAERELVVVVEVPEPVLQPEAAVGLDGAAVHAVVEVGPRHAQLDVLRAIVPAAHPDDVGLVDLGAGGVGLRREERERQLGLLGSHKRARDQRAGLAGERHAAQLKARRLGVLRRAVGEELLVGVVAQRGLKAPQEIVVLAHGFQLPSSRSIRKQCRSSTRNATA